ncbi:copper-binding protein [Serratia microhaemolytica]|jgi:Cu(I)/Ag(I) efflux system protein CusF|uniref:copper-binding protein n=1 Tax=Serratia microhaemolytica TaxID=2675110 RepID=UPI000FDF2EFB|nr:copper-binding protein [Serratia microhaemolytica]
MRQSIKTALFGLVSVIMVAGAQAAEPHHGTTATAIDADSPQIISSAGVVKEIDLKNMKVTIAHEAIPSLSWPAMTMRFTFTALDDSIRALKVGNRVNFTFVQQDTVSLLKEIKNSQS